MTGTTKRGGVAVGLLSEIGPIEAAAVMFLRAWSDGPEAREAIRGEMSVALGRDVGERAIYAFEAICDTCLRHGRRPLLRHDITCKCLGADEACFANFIAQSCEGDREDAILIASLLVRTDMAMLMVDHAATFGLTLKRLSLAQARRDAAVHAAYPMH